MICTSEAVEDFLLSTLQSFHFPLLTLPATLAGAASEQPLRYEPHPAIQGLLQTYFPEVLGP